MNNQKPNQTYHPIPSAEDQTRQFVKAQKKLLKGNGENNFLDALETISKILLANSDNGQTFTVNDMRHLSIALEIPHDDITDYFAKWTKSLIEGKRLKKIPSCYDIDVFQTV